MEGRRKIIFFRGDCMSKVREIGMNVVCVGNNEKIRLNGIEGIC